MNFGLHVRVGAGYDDSVAYAQKLGCSALQFFSGNPKTYRVGAIDAPALARFAGAREAAGIPVSAIHTSYLINLASDDPKISNGSLRLLANDLAVAAAGSVPFVNTHLGSYGKRDRNEGFAQVVAALEKALEDIKPGVYLVMENSAGAGQLCGGTIEELGALPHDRSPATRGVSRHRAFLGRGLRDRFRGGRPTGSSIWSNARWDSIAW